MCEPWRQKPRPEIHRSVTLPTRMGKQKTRFRNPVCSQGVKVIDLACHDIARPVVQWLTVYPSQWLALLSSWFVIMSMLCYVMFKTTFDVYKTVFVWLISVFITLVDVTSTKQREIQWPWDLTLQILYKCLSSSIVRKQIVRSNRLSPNPRFSYQSVSKVLKYFHTPISC